MLSEEQPQGGKPNGRASMGGRDGQRGGNARPEWVHEGRSMRSRFAASLLMGDRWRMAVLGLGLLRDG